LKEKEEYGNMAVVARAGAMVEGYVAPGFWWQGRQGFVTKLTKKTRRTQREKELLPAHCSLPLGVTAIKRGSEISLTPLLAPVDLMQKKNLR
jgi:hypothetical protein